MSAELSLWIHKHVRTHHALHALVAEAYFLLGEAWMLESAVRA